MEQKSATVKPLYLATRIVWYLTTILESLLAFRFFLKFLSASPEAWFTSFVYGITSPFVAPFVAVFRRTQFQGGIFEWTTILAMAVYWLLAWAIVWLFLISEPQRGNKVLDEAQVLISKPVSREEAARKLDEQERDDN